jgi:hypothetical protein
MRWRQSSHHGITRLTLFTVARRRRQERASASTTATDGDTMPVKTAHFGLTLLRTSKLKQLPKPWFHSTPSPVGRLER